jgi:hypothetical protein
VATPSPCPRAHAMGSPTVWWVYPARIHHGMGSPAPWWVPRPESGWGTRHKMGEPIAGVGTGQRRSGWRVGRCRIPWQRGRGVRLPRWVCRAPPRALAGGGFRRMSRPSQSRSTGGRRRWAGCSVHCDGLGTRAGARTPRCRSRTVLWRSDRRNSGGKPNASCQQKRPDRRGQGDRSRTAASRTTGARVEPVDNFLRVRASSGILSGCCLLTFRTTSVGFRFSLTR